MHSYSIEEARRIVMQCAKQYQTNLLGKQFMLIYRERNDNQVKDIEFRFEKGNYQHLTGIEMIDENGDIREHVSELLYSKCLNNQLAKDEIRFKKNGTTNLKLLALPVMMDLHKVTKIAGDFNYSRPYLVADKVIGNVNFCLGLRRADEYYVPASVLLEDIKKLTNVQSQVLAIFSREAGEERYFNIRHVAKGLNLNNLVIPEDIAERISLESYAPKEK